MKTTDPRDAGRLLLQREYSEIAECGRKSHDPVFIPDSYLYEGLVEKVTLLNLT
jgi:hypothetical protein